MCDSPKDSDQNTNDIEHLRGSGPAPGVIEISDRYPSVKAFLNHHVSSEVRTWHDGVERRGDVFVFDPVREIFAVGDPRDIDGSPHQKLARAIGVEDFERVVGGTWTRGESGEVITTELSGHYGGNWARDPGVREQFVEFLERRTGLSVRHFL